MNLLARPLVLAYQGVRPVFHGALRRCEIGSAVLGRVTLGAQAVLERFAVLRGDGHVITVGRHFHLGAHSTVHIAHAICGTTIGDRVAVGAHAVVHACTVGDDCVVEDGAVVQDAAIVGNGSVVAAGSVVFARTVLPAATWCEGVPAVPVRAVTPQEREALQARIRDPQRAATLPTAAEAIAIAIHGDSDGDGDGDRDRDRDSDGDKDGDKDGHGRGDRDGDREVEIGSNSGGSLRFLARTVRGHGLLQMATGSSLWFGCVVQAGAFGVTIGAGSNVQDNSWLVSEGMPLTIGPDCTIGHNVRLHDCAIGARVLVGMGSTLAAGTVTGDDVLIAAGSSTVAGQVLEGGWLWAGRPARQLSRLDERKVRMIHAAAAVYRDYAVEFSNQQAAGPLAAPACAED